MTMAMTKTQNPAADERRRVVAIVDKGGNAEIRIAIDMSRGTPERARRVIDIRTFYRPANFKDADEMIPTKRGITVMPARAAEIARGIHAALEQLRKEEARTDEPESAQEQSAPEGGPGQAVRLAGEGEESPAPSAKVVKPYPANPLPRRGPDPSKIRAPGDVKVKWPLEPPPGTPEHLREDGGSDSTFVVEWDDS
jgi:hypothetical protein